MRISQLTIYDIVNVAVQIQLTFHVRDILLHSKQSDIVRQCHFPDDGVLEAEQC